MELTFFQTALLFDLFLNERHSGSARQLGFERKSCVFIQADV